MPEKARRSVALLALTALLTGCQSGKPANHFEGSGTRGSVSVAPSDLVVLDLPSINMHMHGIITITGTVHRKPGVSGELPGRVDIEFLDAEGQYLDGLPVLLSPRSVPIDPNAVASYTTNYGYIPPDGSTIRVHFVDKETAIEEDLAGDNYSAEGKGAHGGYGGGHTPHGGGGGGGTHTGGGMGSHW